MSVVMLWSGVYEGSYAVVAQVCTSVVMLWLFRRVRVRGAGGWQRSASPDQRSELHPLQDVRHQGPQPEHQLGGAAGRGGPGLQRHVDLVVSSPDTRRRAWPCSQQHMTATLDRGGKALPTIECRPDCHSAGGVGTWD